MAKSMGMKMPANIDWYETLETLPYLLGSLPAEVQSIIGKIPSYMVKQSRGNAYWKAGKPICYTIPVWVLGRSRDYQMWYVAHEVSHVLDCINRGKSDHGIEFHKILKRICPFESQYYEWEYMSRSKARGLGSSDEIDNLEDMI